MRRSLGWLCLGMLAAGGAVQAQTANTPVSAELVQTLLNRIEMLEKRVAELEGKGAPAPPPVAAAPPAFPMGHEHEAEMAGQSIPSGPLMKVSGFGDLNFSGTDQRGARSGFNEGQFTLHTTSVLSPRVTVFGEVTLTARADAGATTGGAPSAPGFNAELERLLIRFDQSDYFKVSFGRYHTPINYWNTAYHHGQWLQTTVSRPEMTQFGGRFIPVHFVGGLLEGALPAGGLNLNYNVGLGNGRGPILSRGGDAGDSNNHKAWLVNLFSKPDRFFGLQAGGSAYRDEVNVGPRVFNEWVTSGHIVWHKETPEVIAEVANVNHTEVGRPGSFNSQAYYLQFAYRLPWGKQLWKPYYRWEYIHIPRTEPVLAGVPSLAGSLVGIRYDITSFAAIKMEYRNQRRPGLPRINGGFLQTSFTF